MLHFRLGILSLALLSAISFGAQAEETSTTIITTPATPTSPATVEKYVVVSPAPQGVCTTVNAHWENGIWIAAHQICQYENRTEGVKWIGEYWSCTASTSDGNCTTWVLVPGHWSAQ